MTKDTVHSLQHLLDTEEGELAFLNDVPDETVDTLHQAIQSTLESEADSLTQAIDTGTRELPILLSQVAGSILR